MEFISEEEKQRRIRIVGSVLGTHAMEGIQPDVQTQALYRRYESGELSFDQLDRALEIHASSLVDSLQPLAGVA